MKAQSKLAPHAAPIEFSRWFNDQRDHEPGGIFEYLDQHPVVNTHWDEGGQLVVEYSTFKDVLAYATVHVGQYVYVGSKDQVIYTFNEREFWSLFEILDDEGEELKKQVVDNVEDYMVIHKDRYEMLVKYENAIQDVVSRFGDV